MKERTKYIVCPMCNRYVSVSVHGVVYRHGFNGGSKPCLQSGVNINPKKKSKPWSI